MKRAAVWLLICLVIGILCGWYKPDGFYIVLFVVLLLSGIGLIEKRDLLFLLLPAAVLAGYTQIQAMLSPADRIMEWYCGDKVAVEGEIIDVDISSSGNTLVSLNCDKLVHQTTALAVNAKVMLILEEKHSLLPGDRIAAFGRLSKLEGSRNPGGFHQKIYYGARGYDYSMYSKEYVMDEWSTETGFSFKMYQLRQGACNIFDRYLPPRYAGVMKAMITGDKSGMEKDLTELYRKGGIAHILAISGLHVSILAMVCYFFLFSALHLGKRTSSGITICLLFGFLLFTGFGVSTTRAVLMSSFALLGNILYRKATPVYLLSVSALIILVVQPLYLWDISFQLSFVTSGGICLGMEMVKNNQELPGFIKNYVMVSVIASVFSYPLICYYFYRIPMMGIVINCIVVPFLGALVVLGMGMLGPILIFPFISAVFTFAIGLILRFYEYICTVFTSPPFGDLLIGRPAFITIAAIYGMLLSVYFLHQRRKIATAGIILCAGLFLASVFSNRFFFKETEVAFLDVGQGDCAVITTYDQKAFVIDGGGRGYQEEGDNTGLSIVKPYLDYKGIDYIDILFISHMDSDHALGALELMENMKIGAVAIAEYDRKESALYERFLKTVDEKKIHVYSMNIEDELDFGSEMRFTCLYPVTREGFGDQDENHGSMVIRFQYGERAFLFTGDIDVEDEGILLQTGGIVTADVLKLAHHGSKYSSSDVFLQQVQCERAVVSAGANNVYGHPAPEILERLEQMEIPYYNTAVNGAIVYKTNGKSLRCKVQLKGEGL